MIQVKRFDRKKESLNKIKYRSKGGPLPGGGPSSAKHKSYKQESSLCGQFQIPPTGANEVFVSNYHVNPQLNQILDRILEEYPDEFGHLEEPLKKSSMLKFRDILNETAIEFNRLGEFVRIFPSKHSKPYEKYFSGLFGTRMLNRIVHKVLFTNEILPYEKLGNKLQSGNAEERKPKVTDPKNLKYDIDVPQQQSYDHYRNRALQQQKSGERGIGASATQGAALPRNSKETLDDSEEEVAPYKQDEQKQTYQKRSTSSNAPKKGDVPSRNQDKVDQNRQANKSPAKARESHGTSQSTRADN